MAPGSGLRPHPSAYTLPEPVFERLLNKILAQIPLRFHRLDSDFLVLDNSGFDKSRLTTYCATNLLVPLDLDLLIIPQDFILFGKGYVIYSRAWRENRSKLGNGQ